MSDRSPSPAKAFLDSRAVVALLAGGVTAAATGLWWLIAPTGALYFWLVRNASAEAADPLGWEEPDLSDLRAPYRRWAETGLDVQRRINAEMRTVPEYLRDAMHSTWLQVKSVGLRQLALVRQMQSLEDYLERLNIHRLNTQWQELAGKHKAAFDPAARAGYEQAMQSVSEQMENIQELRASAQRIDAQLQTVQQSLEGVYGQVLRLKTANARVGDREIGELTSDLDQLSDQVSTLSDSVEQVYVRTGGSSS